MNRYYADGMVSGLNIVYIDGIPKVFNSNGEEIREVIDLVLNYEHETYNKIEIKAYCNVYSTVEEMKANINKEQLFSIQEGDVKITINRSKVSDFPKKGEQIR